MKRVLVYGMTDNPGGIESYVMNIYRRLDLSEIIFDFVVDFPVMAYSDEVIAAGSRIFYIPSKSSHPVKHLTMFRRILSEHPEYDTVYFNILNAGAAYTITVARIMKRKVFIHSHNSRDCNMKLHKLFLPLLNSFKAVKLACSVSAAEYMFKAEKDVKIIHNGIDAEKFYFSPELRSTARKELGIDDNVPLFLHIGRISVQKNPRFLVEIMAETAKRDDSAVLLWAGTGEMEEEIKSLCKSFGLERRIIFLGKQNNVNRLYQAADVFLLPSLFEGLPIVGIEAQVSGLPCLISDTVTKETAITDLVDFLPIDDAAVWSKAALKRVNTQRTCRKSETEQSGYTAENTVKAVCSLLYEN